MLFVLLLFFLLSEGGIIKGINDSASKFVQHADDFSEGFLVGEVLLWGKGDEGLDECSLLAVRLDLVLDLLQSGVEFLDLEEGWVVQVGQKGEGIIDSLSGSVHFANVGLELLVLLSSNKGGLVEVLSVLSLIVLEGSDLFPELLSSGLQEVFDAVISSGNVDFGILDILLKGDDEWVVFVSSNSEVKVKIDQFFVEVLEKFLDSVNKLLNGSSSKWVQLSHLEDSATPLALLELSNGSLSGLAGWLELEGKGASGNQKEDGNDFHYYFYLSRIIPITLR